MDYRLKVKLSKYMSYLLRHNPDDLKIDKHGFVDLDELLTKIRERFPIDKDLILQTVEESDRKRFEVKRNKIRALYGHTIPVELKLEEEKTISILYHGTTQVAAFMILEEGLRPMKRRWVHLSPTIEVATSVGRRKTAKPTILEIDVRAARKEGVKFYRATEKVYLCGHIQPKYIKQILCR